MPTLIAVFTISSLFSSFPLPVMLPLKAMFSQILGKSSTPEPHPCRSLRDSRLGLHPCVTPPTLLFLLLLEEGETQRRATRDPSSVFCRRKAVVGRRRNRIKWAVMSLLPVSVCHSIFPTRRAFKRRRKSWIPCTTSSWHGSDLSCLSWCLYIPITSSLCWVLQVGWLSLKGMSELSTPRTFLGL